MALSDYISVISAMHLIDTKFTLEQPHNLESLSSLNLKSEFLHSL